MSSVFSTTSRNASQNVRSSSWSRFHSATESYKSPVDEIVEFADVGELAECVDRILFFLRKMV